jgi:hypothetical protein
VLLAGIVRLQRLVGESERGQSDDGAPGAALGFSSFVGSVRVLFCIICRIRI